MQAKAKARIVGIPRFLALEPRDEVMGAEEGSEKNVWLGYIQVVFMHERYLVERIYVF